jgi:hypothetical protein
MASRKTAPGAPRCKQRAFGLPVLRSRLEIAERGASLLGGGRRLSGFLPAQCVYADIYVVDALWPDFDQAHFDSALEWFGQQDRSLGG